MNVENEISEIFNKAEWFSNLGQEIEYEIKYSFSYMKSVEELDKVMNGAKYINSELEITNNLRSCVAKNLQQEGLKELNIYIKNIKVILSGYNNVLIEICENNKISNNFAVLLNGYIINFFLERFVNSKCNEKYSFFNDILKIFLKGNVVAGCYFTKNKRQDIYNIITYPVDSQFKESAYSTNNINLVVF